MRQEAILLMLLRKGARVGKAMADQMKWKSLSKRISVLRQLGYKIKTEKVNKKVYYVM